ncbi:uncharacterized protein C3orf20-like [Rhinophrynus dorsalis]
MVSRMLSPGPLYFYDQVKTRTIKRAKKMPEELSLDMKYMNINPRLANFINSLNRNKKGVSGQAEKQQAALPKEDKERKEKYPVLPDISGTNLSKPCTENAAQKASHFLPEEEQFMTPIDEYKYAAPTLLYELGKLLHFFSQYEITFPQGVVNVLNYSWKELIEGAVLNKRHPLACKRVTTDRNLAPEEGESKGPGAGAPPENGDSMKNNKSKMNATQAEGGKEKGRQEAMQNRLAGNKSPQSTASHLPVTISFSMSSRACEDRGWICQKQDSESEDMEWKALCAWAVERLQLSQIQINKQAALLKEKGFCRPVILRHYDINKKDPLMRQRKATKHPPFVLVNGKPQIPEIKRENVSLRKLHYALNDGSSMSIYPSGHLAVCQSYSGLPCGGLYTNIFSSDQTILGTFTPFGHGSVCFPDSSTFALQYNHISGVLTDKEGGITQEWDWPRKTTLSDPILLQVNEYLSIRIAGQYSVSLCYKWQHETVRLSLSPLVDVSPPQMEDVGILLISENFSSRTAREMCKANKKKVKEKDGKKSTKKMKSVLSELAKTLEIPEDHISPLNDFNAATELKKLQRKIRNIADDWMEHYRLASGLDSPHIQKMSEAPLRTSRKRKIKSAAVLPVTSPDPKSQPVKEGDVSGASNTDGPHLQGRFLSAPSHSHIMRWGTPQSSTSPRTLAISSFLLLTLEQDPEKLWYMSHFTCPVVLQRLMLGEEGRICRCNNHQIPYVTDFEYDLLINNKMTSPEQIIVVCVVSSLNSEEDHREDVLDQLYEKRNRYRSMPCMQSRIDSFRLLKYDIITCSELTGRKESLLVQRHNVAPGMFLMYMRGKLLFANYIFNGYSRSIKDLQKQIVRTRSDYQMGYSLPNDFKFRCATVDNRELTELSVVILAS